MSESRQEVLLGNEAIARGIVESGCHVVTSYPGTPSSEILPAVVRFKKELGLNTHVEWSINEKVAYEVALAASYTGKRAAVIMKQVGLNVAADPLMSSAYTGVKGGFLIISCDDPGPHSSQTEQDTRFYALFAKVPALDPSSPREAREMVKAAFELSERHRLPVILRPAIRVSHARENVEFMPVLELERPAQFDKDPGRWAATPRFRLQLHKELNEKLNSIQEEFETSDLNASIPGEDGRLGFIAGGSSYSVLKDTLRELELEGRFSILKIGTSHPLPQKVVADFVAGCEQVVVLEEPDAVVELQILDKRKVLGRLNGVVPSAGELTPEVIGQLVAQQAERLAIRLPKEIDTGELAQLVADVGLPVRRPRLCPGCMHRAAFFGMKRALGSKAIYPGDIGCYTLGINLNAVDTCLDMGGSVTIASGLYQAYQQDGEKVAIAATIGDSTFLHSGVPPLANAVYNGARFVLVILDNSTTAMTGMQPTADSGVLADGSMGRRVAIKDLVQACGVKFVEEIDPYRVKDFEALVKRARDYTREPDGGVAVIIAKHPCVLYDPSPLHEHPVRVTVTEDCDGCEYCQIAFECPALVLDQDLGRVVVDRRNCVNCGVCLEACPKGCIVEAEE
ncbi:MAG TPA: indolepyruvate ferredoxin oxidoreductase subunit alpha [Anaerolineae bacterium]|nr:indolepyruvate ferredoxin oxidoreductase subunit alpha [Anaerolineae bacterium]